MSTKIYEAYRLRRTQDLWSFVHDAHTKGRAKAKQILLNILSNLMQEVDTSSEAYKAYTATYRTSASVSEDRCRLAYAHRTLRDRYKDQVTSSSINEYDFRACIAIREHEGRLYLIPHRGLPFGQKKDTTYGDVLSFLSTDRRLTDYSYWDNVDPPKNISTRAWRERRRTWNAMCEHWDDCLVIDVCSYEDFYKIDPHLELSERVRAAERRHQEEIDKHVRPSKHLST